MVMRSLFGYTGPTQIFNRHIQIRVMNVHIIVTMLEMRAHDDSISMMHRITDQRRHLKCQNVGIMIPAMRMNWS